MELCKPGKEETQQLTTECSRGSPAGSCWRCRTITLALPYSVSPPMPPAASYSENGFDALDVPFGRVAPAPIFPRAPPASVTHTAAWAAVFPFPRSVLLFITTNRMCYRHIFMAFVFILYITILLWDGLPPGTPNSSLVIMTFLWQLSYCYGSVCRILFTWRYLFSAVLPRNSLTT